MSAGCGHAGVPAALPVVLFRCEAGGTAGFGHLSRCLALAAALDGCASCCFDLEGCDEAAGALISEAGFGEASPVAPDALVFDGYGFADAAISAARAISSPSPVVMVIDDFGARRIDCDIVVCPGPQRTARDWAVPPSCRLLLGPRHAPLGPAFTAAPRAAVAEVSRLLLGFGGTDAGDATARLLPLLPRGLTVDVLLGPGYRGSAAARPGVTVHRALGAEAVARLMADADAAITAPGVMALELLAIGRPALLFSLSARQEDVGRALAHAGLACHGGELAERDDAAVEGAITSFLADRAGRAAQVRAALAMDVAGGAARVAAVLLAALAARADLAQERGR